MEILEGGERVAVGNGSVAPTQYDALLNYAPQEPAAWPAEVCAHPFYDSDQPSWLALRADSEAQVRQRFIEDTIQRLAADKTNYAYALLKAALDCAPQQSLLWQLLFKLDMVLDDAFTALAEAGAAVTPAIASRWPEGMLASIQAAALAEAAQSD